MNSNMNAHLDLDAQYLDQCGGDPPKL